MNDTTLQIISIVAIVIGPIAALMMQRILDRLREKEKRKQALFYTLLTTRATPMSIQHVQALNSIELEFYPRKAKKARVIDAWRIYSDHLNQPCPYRKLCPVIQRLSNHRGSRSILASC